MVTEGRLEFRSSLVQRMLEDLIGPGSEQEVLREKPSDRYLTGILFPPAEEVSPEEDDVGVEAVGTESPDDQSSLQDVTISRAYKPSSIGLSFRIKGTDPDLHVSVTGGFYSRQQTSDEAAGSDTKDSWIRHPVNSSLTLSLKASGFINRLPVKDVADHFLTGRISRNADDSADVTLVLVNMARGNKGPVWSEEHSLFQAKMSVVASDKAGFVPRTSRPFGVDEESQSNDLLFREASEFATGHVCAASWDLDVVGCRRVETTWAPVHDVPGVSARGSAEFHQLGDSAWKTDTGLEPLSAAWLAEASPDRLITALDELSSCYERWIDNRTREAASIAASLSNPQRQAATLNLNRCRTALDRIRAGSRLLRADEKVRLAFQLANKVMQMQRVDDKGRPDPLHWRPFQLAFQVLNIPSLSQRSHADRGIMDLLWFPTGGGKTEAYLGLIAFVLLYRRLSANPADKGAGVGAIMRYTLRLLTAQQFQRAAAMICACEQLRAARRDLGTAEFSLGLWVGESSTPNRDAEARTPQGLEKVQKTLINCPICRGQLTVPTHADLGRRCRNETCHFHTRQLPVYVVDDHVYEKRPSLIIGTVDKFAQITRQERIEELFSLDGNYSPPDLILQDELHLISGPLGTIASIYEVAVDEFCSRDGSRPKVIGSTATIRRASSQVRALFNRGVHQFPPPGLEHGDSGFAVVDYDVPTRQYVGLTTAGRSPKFALQAVIGTLAQGAFGLATGVDERFVDPYWTSVIYFNALRELGGALVLVEDDVSRSMRVISERRAETTRILSTPSEITSRVPSEDIAPILDALSTPYPDCEVDVVLASNMISVGVDVQRLGLMVVNGQPKTTAEYIQATSRIGRQTPGLVVVLYNNQRPRDRSRFESFATWHQALYREVEATSVTPFSSRARDRALHAALVALVRFGFGSRKSNPRLRPADTAKIERAIKTIVSRAEEVDPDEAMETENHLTQLVEAWKYRIDLIDWWLNSYKPRPSLMIGAEESAALQAQKKRADAWSTLNSMREVEAATTFRFAPSLRRRSPDA